MDINIDTVQDYIVDYLVDSGCDPVDWGCDWRGFRAC